MIGRFNGDGNLEKGIHECEWPEFYKKFGTNPHRRLLLRGMKDALHNLKNAGCITVYVDGSFVTLKEIPNDYDAIWGVENVDPIKLDQIFFDFNNSRASQKMKYYGEFFPSSMIERKSNSAFLNFFQIDKETGVKKGVVKMDLRRLN